MRSISGLTEPKAKTDKEEGFTDVKPEKSANMVEMGGGGSFAFSSLASSVLDCRPVLKVSGGAFERLQEDEEDEEEEAPGFQSQASMYEEKETRGAC